MNAYIYIYIDIYLYEEFVYRRFKALVRDLKQKWYKLINMKKRCREKKTFYERANKIK